MRHIVRISLALILLFPTLLSETVPVGNAQDRADILETGQVLSVADNRDTYSDSRIPRYAKFELTFDLSIDYAHPYYYYDPEDTPERDPNRESPYGVDGVSVDAHFITPSGLALTVPAFWYQDFTRWRSGDREYLEMTGSPVWKVRFAPAEVGQYNYYITVRDRNGATRYPQSGYLTFESAPSDAHGFIRVDSDDPRFLEYDDGSPFIAISGGLQYWSVAGGIELKSYFYEDRFDIFGEHGINLVRVWDQNDGYGLTLEGEWSDGKPPDPAAVPAGTQINQANAYREDRIIEAAERNGIAIQLCSHGDVLWSWDASVVYDPEWNPNPVSWTDYRHLNYWRRNFRYRVARFGYSTSILAWDTWNEHGHIESDSSIYDFYQEYGSFQEQIDPYHHLRTTGQGSQVWDPAFWSSPAFDLATYHDYMMTRRYPDELAYDATNFVHRFSQCLRNEDLDYNQGGCGLGIRSGTLWNGGPRPWLWSEFGVGTDTWDEPHPDGNRGEGGLRATHNRLWAGLFSPLGTAPIEWYWYYQDNDWTWYSQKHDRSAVARAYVGGLDYAGSTFLATDDVNVDNYVGETVTVDHAKLRVLAIRPADDRGAFVWVQHRDHTWVNADWTPAPIDAHFVLPNVAPGLYRVERWNTTTGAHATDSALVSPDQHGNLSIAVNDLQRDQALKILPADRIEYDIRLYLPLVISRF